MTEIQFLLDIIMNHKLSADVKAKLLARIGEVEQRLTNAQPIRQQHVASSGPIEPQAIVHNTAAVQAALANRQALMNNAANGVEEPGRKSARKF